MRNGTRTFATITRIAAVILTLVMAGGLLAGCGVFESASDESVSQGYSDRALDSAMAPDMDVMSEEVYDDEGYYAEPTVGTGTDASSLPAEDRLIIRNKSLRLEVDDVRDTVDEIRDIADAHAGTVTNVNVSTDDGYLYRYDEYGMNTGSGEALSGWITVRVPAEDFDSFVDAVDDLGEVLWEGETTDDVTQQHVDLSARLENLKVEEERLREFFDAADNVEEMLQIERELSRVRGEIESHTAQIAYFERQAAMSTVTIELSEPRPVVRPAGPDWGFSGALTSGLQLAANVVKALIVIVLGALPVLALGALAFFVIRAIVRSRRARQTG